MKKPILLTLIFVCAIYSISFAQLDSRKDKQLLIFGKVFLYITNDYIEDINTSKQPAPLFTKPDTVYYNVIGQELDMNILQMDSADAFHGHVSFNASVGFIDTSAIKKMFYNTENLQARVWINGKLVTGWQSITNFTAFKEPSILQNGSPKSYKTTYRLVHRELNISDSITVDIKKLMNGAQIQILSIHIKRIPLLIQPFLAQITHDSSQTSPDAFIQHEVGDWMYKAAGINTYYSNQPGNGLIVNNVQYFPSSKLAFYFRRPDNYPDSSLEYKLTGGIYDDTSWVTSGHLVLVPRLQPNAHYELLVRYKNGSSTMRYTFYVAPLWHQKYLYLIIYIPSFLLVFFTALLVAQYRVKRAERRRQKLALELKSIRAQLNPHFVFNALSSIQALIHKNNIDDANQYLTDFSSLLRESLTNHDSDLVPASADVKALENYIRLEQLRFNFTYAISVSDYINMDTVEIPSLLLQPLVENAIKHGISPLKENGRLEVRFTKTGGNNLQVTVEDNGEGFDTALAAGNSYGLKLTRDRINILNQTLKGQHISMQINSNTGGTIVTLLFTHWL